MNNLNFCPFPLFWVGTPIALFNETEAIELVDNDGVFLVDNDGVQLIDNG